MYKRLCRGSIFLSSLYERWAPLWFSEMMDSHAYVLSVYQKGTSWWLTYPEVFSQHSVLAGSYQTPKHAGTLPLCPTSDFTGEKVPTLSVDILHPQHIAMTQFHMCAHFYPPKSALTEGKHECDGRQLWKHYLEAVKRNLLDETTLFLP